MSHHGIQIEASYAQKIQGAAVELKYLVIWTVYCRPLDLTEEWVARPWLITPGNAAKTIPLHLVGCTLEQLREKLPHGLTRLERNPGDDPAIVETWL